MTRSRLIKSSYCTNGFTLIELLVVISIIALLVSILLPTLSAARQAAQATVCLSNLRQLATASTVYLNDNKEMMPPVYHSGGSWMGWYDHLHDYFGREQGQAGRFNEDETGHYLLCPTDNEGNQRRTSYAANRAVGPGTYVRYGSVFNYQVAPGKVETLTHPLSKVAWYADAGSIPYAYGYEIYFMKSTNTQLRNLSWRHTDTLNAVFMDTHGERLQNPDFISDPTLMDTSPWAEFFGL